MPRLCNGYVGTESKWNEDHTKYFEGYKHSIVIFCNEMICVTTNKPSRTRRVHIWLLETKQENDGTKYKDCTPVGSFDFNLFKYPEGVGK